MLIRQRLLTAALAAERAHVREVGLNNHGPEVKTFLAEVGLPEGYAWCAAFVSYEAHAAAGRRLPIESASVAVTYAKARELHWLVGTLSLDGPKLPPAKGDLVLYDFDSDGQTDDHIGIVISAGAFGSRYWKLTAVEGNTSSGKAGSQADGGGVYVRTRIVKRSSVAFVRIPGIAPPAPAVYITRGTTTTMTSSSAGSVSTIRVNIAPKKPAKKPPAPEPTLKKGSRGPAVRKLQKLLAKHGAKITVDGDFGQRTAASVKAFQRRNGLKPDGQVGPKTWKKLRV